MSSVHDLQFKSINYTGLGQGTRLIVTGAVHGNETCGTVAIRRVMEELDSGKLLIARGSVTFVPITNPLAYRLQQRSGERNLNRNLFPNEEPKDFEDRIANWLCPLLASHDVLLDLHSFNAESEPFVMVGPQDNDGPLQPFKHAAKERAMAKILGVRRFVDGWLATYGAGVQRRTRDAAQLQTVLRYGVGTTEYMRSTGGYALTLECGQHQDPAAPDVAYRAIMNVLAHLQLIDAPAPTPVGPKTSRRCRWWWCTTSWTRATASAAPGAVSIPSRWGRRSAGAPMAAPCCPNSRAASCSRTSTRTPTRNGIT